ncbi:MAG TPA: CopD family protein [Anaerolineae bacterium]
MFNVNTPALLAISYFFHLVATVVWIGGLAAMALVVWPGLRHAIRDDVAFAHTIESIEARFRPLSGLSLAVLIITGLVQMTASKNYNGFLNLSNLWAQAIFLKHLAIIGMIAVGVAMSFGVQPALQRNAMLAAHGVASEAEAVALRKRLDRLARVNLILGVVVLVFTAIARAQ